MEVRLINFPSMGGEEIAGMAAAQCTNSANPMKALMHSMKSGHDSVLEHATYSFLITGVSRVLLAQLTRHRIASYSVKSQRYVDMSREGYVTPDSIAQNDALKEKYLELQMEARRLYQNMLNSGIPKEDARYILPEATSTDLILTMNARELKHFFGLRCCNRAQWEIRELADKMLELCRLAAPELFRVAGPSCVTDGVCYETRSCGHPRKELIMDE